jgi:hypothetical protein
MKRLAIGECNDDDIFNLVDPTSFVEVSFEAEVVKAFTCLEPDYWCGVFAGAFTLEGERRTADLALIHKSFSHWFVVEVELAGHSLEHHVLPQVRCFRYGEADQSCVTALIHAFPQITREAATQILLYLPRFVAVVGNLPDSQWSTALLGLGAQYLTVSIYRNRIGNFLHEVEGRLTATAESLGFARYSAIDNCLRISKGSGLPVGKVQIVDQFGNPAIWTIREESGVLWLSKDRGPALLNHESFIQLIRTSDGVITLRPSTI